MINCVAGVLVPDTCFKTIIFSKVKIFRIQFILFNFRKLFIHNPVPIMKISLYKFLLPAIILLSIMACQKDPVIDNKITVTAFPNPTTSNFAVSVSNPDQKQFKLSVFDTGGALIESITSEEENPVMFANISEKPEGYYTVVLISDNNTNTLKVLKL